MVTISDYKACQNSAGETFFALVLQGGIELVKSKTTGKMYATAKKATITSTFDEATCKTLIGTKLKGSIIKAPCEAYNYTVPEIGEAIQLSHTYQFSDEAVSVEESVFEGVI